MSSESDSLPDIPDDDSRGSSVSSSLQREYDELLRYAVVTPKVLLPQSVYETESLRMSKQADESSSVSDSKSSSTSTSTSSSQNTYAEDHDVSKLAREDVKLLPSTPAPRVTFQGEGSLARDSLLRSETSGASHEENQDSPCSETSEPSPHAHAASPGIDPDLARMETLVDSWSLDLKRNILAEVAQYKMGLLEKQKQMVMQERRKHGAEMNRLLNEMESQKELLLTFEQTLKHKDSIVANMTLAINKQREKFELLRTFTSWKLRHNDEKREVFSSKLARRHYQQMLKGRVWSGWRSVIESKWKQRVEKACQAKSQEVCVKLTEDYEQKLETAHRELEQARAEIARLHSERDHYEETMKKAFMRGVCALNMEAMGMFREGEESGGGGGRQEQPGDGRPAHSDTEDMPRYHRPRPMDQTYGTAGAHPGYGSQTRQPPLPEHAQATSGRTVTIKAVARADLQGAKPKAGMVGTQGPVSSIFVQKHTAERDSSAPPMRRPVGQRSAPSKAPGTRAARAPPVQTIRSTPVKVVQ